MHTASKSGSVRPLGLLALGALACAACSSTPDAPQASSPSAPVVAARTRNSFIAAEEVQWDYAPQGLNVFTGEPFDDSDATWAVHQPDGPTPRIGRVNWKARYVEYTDATFTTRKPTPQGWEHLGILGPLLRANVGDTLRVVFKNATSFEASIHVHGLEYEKVSEGSPYADGTPQYGARVRPGETYTYIYEVPESSGPAPGQPSSQVWLYHSHVSMEESDIYAGLIGGIVVCRRGAGNADAVPTDVDREFMTLFMVMDENASALLKKNIDTYLPGFTNPAPEDFEESNKKHAINGYLMGNLPGLVMKSGERVRWYLVALGNEVDLHTPHWHGSTVVSDGRRTDVVELLPATMLTADMRPRKTGKWAFHCHVSDHMLAGMTALYTVE
jgi:FtsP/CotA-like multicopper oxidase with cupredoxin domain